MLKVFIERPVLSTVISVIIVILGILGLVTLPIAQYPDIAPPTVQVSASYPGANADVVLNSIIIPLEEQINGVEDMTYMSSTSTNEGAATITVVFKVGTNPDLAAVNVQNRVSRATALLPAEVTQAGVTVVKRQTSNLLIFALNSENPAYDQTFLQNYAKINLVPRIQRVTGVGDVTVFGSRDYSMRIWLKPQAMQAYGLMPSDITAALAEQNIEAAPGKVGENSDQAFQYVIKYTGRLKDATQFENIILKSIGNGQQLLLKDVARVELGAQSYSAYNLVNDHPAVGVAVVQSAGSNARDVINGSKAVLEEAAKNFPPGVKYTVLVDVNRFLDSSIEKVIHTLVEAFILVFIVVFLFLQDFRSTLIPAISVPVAIVGTFFFLNLFGFSINLLTLFALVLAIGIVVDDAIVVVEAVHAKLDHGAKSARKATLSAMNEISGAIVSITLVMSAVFVPVSFITGSAGVFYKQFGLTLAIAIILSAINALTLSPALCALLLKPHNEHEHKKTTFLQRFYNGFNKSFDAITGKYKRAVHFLSIRKWMAILLVALFGGGLFWLMKTTPSSFVPNEDMGTVFASISLPPGSTLERSDSVSKKVAEIARSIDGVNNTLQIVGTNFIAGSGSAYSMVIIELKEWGDRPKRDAPAIIRELFGKTAGIREASSIIFFSPPTVQGFSVSGGFEFQLQDQGGHTINEFYKVNNEFLAALRQRPEIQYVTTSFNPTFPQFQLSLNTARAKDAGVSPTAILSTLQGYFGGIYASNFNQFGKQYRVMIQADRQFRTSEASLNNIYVRNSAGDMAPIGEFVTLERVYGPESISRFNLFTAISIQGSPNEGYSSGDAIKAVQEVAAQSLPTGYGYEFSGITREELSAGGQSVYIFILCLIFVYFLLCAQYESYILPFAVLLSLPVGLAGTFIFNKFFNIDNNIYTQISLIMLIGLLSKNAILIVEFAVQRRRKGESILDAAVDGAVARLRPILMTSFAFIFGLVPLMLASGAGANGNRSIGTSAVGGMLIGTLLGVMVIPALFVIFQHLQEKVGRKNKHEDEDDEDEPGLQTIPAAH
ncbi:efflux RND transporter permease subunit [uncultured Chitinophaga sp.]|uniref:efflux RND transporter permease subunit n=1 Tax=uncultured Chitinophaga sp. TaxID=339340 RepID=UPI0025D17CCE|nr:efflux RND transporter permease subunit [uncultured Chitinophaga sp.]